MATPTKWLTRHTLLPENKLPTFTRLVKKKQAYPLCLNAGHPAVTANAGRPHRGTLTFPSSDEEKLKPLAAGLGKSRFHFPRLCQNLGGLQRCMYDISFGVIRAVILVSCSLDS